MGVYHCCNHIHMEISLNGGIPIAGWLFSWEIRKSIDKWTMTEVSPISGNPHMLWIGSFPPFPTK